MHGAALRCALAMLLLCGCVGAEPVGGPDDAASPGPGPDDLGPSDLGPAAPGDAGADGGAPRSLTVWGVGVGGVIVQKNASGWAIQKSGTAADLSDVWAAAPNLAWAVGKSGTILRWDGVRWQAQMSKTIEPLRSVRGSGHADVWAVGGGATPVALHWDGTAWTRSPAILPGSMSSLMQVQVGPAGVWACGHATGGMSGRVVTVRHQGGAWLLDQGHGSATATCAGLVAGTGAELFLGLNQPNASGQQASIERWDGARWTQVADLAQARLVGMSGGWASIKGVGTSALLRWSGTGYQELPSLGPQTGAIWADGADVLGLERNQVLRWNGSDDWTALYTAPGTLLSLYGVGF